MPLPPAIRPGLHCGSAPSDKTGITLYGFPRPSGRGSIAALPGASAADSTAIFPRPSGRGSIAAGAAYYANRSVRGFPRPSGRGSIAAWPAAPWHPVASAASPGHQAGAPLRRGGAEFLGHVETRLPPAIRPGLHCGADPDGSRMDRRPASPGHQAGAPLRPPRAPRRVLPHADRLPPAIRPGLHCGGERVNRRADLILDLPPAIRPGLHCGATVATFSSAASALPPAIRPGLHCGNLASPVLCPIAEPFPRPSGRGSIAAVRRPAALVRCPSFPRPSGRGSIAAGSARRSL